MWGDNQLAKAEEKLAQGNQRAAFNAYEMAFNNPGQVQGGYERLLQVGRSLRPSVDANWAARWDRLLGVLEARSSATAVTPATAEARTAGQLTAAAAGPPVSQSGPQAGTTVRDPQPYEWATPLIWVFLGFAVLSVMGGLVEASNHSHTVIRADQFGIGHHKASENDWNYAVAGVVAAMVWLGVAGSFALLLGIAPDVRRQANAAATARTG
jgi:hypothetical protein